MLNNLFTIWLIDKDWDGMPLLNEICIASAQVYSNIPITIYTNHKLHLSFLDNTITKIEMIPNELMNKAIKICGDNKAHQSDYLRLYYLNEKPGIYFDTDILFWDNIFQFVENYMNEQQCSILYLKEDKYMITNCFIANNDVLMSKPFFDDMLWNYEHRFIRHSYLFNSQKYMNLMEQRHQYCLECLYSPYLLFNIKWDASNIQELLNEEKVELTMGQHLFNSIKEWDYMRTVMLHSIYENNPIEWLFKVTKEVIDKYIDLMIEEDKNVSEK